MYIDLMHSHAVQMLYIRKGSGPLGVQVLAVDRGAKPHARAPAAPLARVAALGRVPAAVKSWGHGQEHERPRGQLSAAPQ